MRKGMIAILAVMMLFVSGNVYADDCVPQSVLTWVDNRESVAISPTRWQNVRKSLLGQDGGMSLADMNVIYNRRVSNGWSAGHWEPIIAAMNCLKAEAEAAAQAEAEAAAAQAQAEAEAKAKAEAEAKAKAQAEEQPVQPVQAEVEPAQVEVGSNEGFTLLHTNSSNRNGAPHLHESDPYREEYDYAVYLAKWNGTWISNGSFVRLKRGVDTNVLGDWFPRYDIYVPDGINRQTTTLPVHIEAQDAWINWYNDQRLPRGFDDWGKWGPWADLSPEAQSWMEGTLQSSNTTWNLKLQNEFGTTYEAQTGPPAGNHVIQGGKAHWAGTMTRYQVHPNSIAAGYGQERVADGNGGFENIPAAPTMVFETKFGSDSQPGVFNAFIDWPIAAASRTGYLKGHTPKGAGTDTLTTSWHHDGQRWWKTTHTNTSCRCDTWRGITFADGTFDDGELSATFYKTDANNTARFQRDNAAIAGHVRRAKIIGEFFTSEGQPGYYSK